MVPSRHLSICHATAPHVTLVFVFLFVAHAVVMLQQRELH